MHFIFSVEYHTYFGQTLYITGSTPYLGGYDFSRALPLKYQGERWSIELNMEIPIGESFTYKYFVKSPDGSTIKEIIDREICIHDDRAIYKFDEWLGNDQQAPFFHTPFSNLYLPHISSIPKNSKRAHIPIYPKELVISLLAPCIEKDASIYIVGSSPKLGEWSTDKALPLTIKKGFIWEITIPIEETHSLRDKINTSVEYKFIKKYENGTIIWEDGENRVYSIPNNLEQHTNITLSIENSFTNLSTFKPRYAGVAIPIFSLRSQKSGGIGEFLDLKLMADWAKFSGMRIIQVLPINDTTTDGSWSDSYPYNCICVMALHPIYIRIDAIGAFPDKETEAEYYKEINALNSLKFLDYEKVFTLKKRYSYILYKTHWVKCSRSRAYRDFITHNKNWIEVYSKYCAKRDNTKAVNYYKFIQFHLHLQLKEAVEYTHSLGIALKGDIPIGVSPQGVDIEATPKYFHKDGQAGAPPDPFAKDGQNWGFPTYHWEAIARDGYRWWKERLSKMGEYFDAYRIDHILGFFRIWEIPSKFKSGTMGHFRPALPLTIKEINSYGIHFSQEFINEIFLEDSDLKGQYHPIISAHDSTSYKELSNKEKMGFDTLYHDFFYVRHNEFWKRIGYERIPEIVSASNMLPCAEDLGMIPDCVPTVLSNLKILSLEIERMPKEIGVECGNPSKYPYLSVCTTGTHDMETLRGWKSGLTIEQYRDIIRSQLNSPSMFTILPLQDWLTLTNLWRVENPTDERINTPSDSKNLWRYRMIPYMEELLSETTLTEEIKNLIKETRGLS